MTKIVCMSDTHGMWAHANVPKGDILVVTGDIAMHGTNVTEYEWFKEWCLHLIKTHVVDEVVFTAGNHDIMAHKEPGLFASIFEGEPDIHYLENECKTIHGLRFFGSPYSPEFFPEHWVFQSPKEHEKAYDFWNNLFYKASEEGTKDIDVALIHGPPYGLGDLCPAMNNRKQMVNVGCKGLADVLYHYQPKLVVGGHIHEGYGIYTDPNFLFVNASTCTPNYKPTNPPIVVNVK